jgi:AcrR family transcriptional regulator
MGVRVEPVTAGSRRARAERNDQALLDAARDVLATEGAHASVAAIATRAGVGIGSLYRRYRTKEQLFQRLATLALDNWIEAAEAGLADDDPWTGLTHFVTACVEFGQGRLAPIAGSIEVTDEMRAKSQHGDELLAKLLARAQEAGAARGDATPTDVALLIEQLGTSPLLEQLRKQGRDHHLVTQAVAARQRIVAIALDGLRAGHPTSLPGDPPSGTLFTKRWAPIRPH